MFGFAEFAQGARRAAAEAEAPSVPVATSNHLAPFRYRFEDGSKFEGGFGFTEVLLTDYWTLRQRSSQLFETNIYARGIVRRLITNEINTGLHLEATPEEVLLGKQEDDLAEWSENVENRFGLWENDARLCDQNERLTFGQLQAIARLEALVAGDVLVVMRQDQRTKLPRIQLINGAKIQDPFLGMNELPGPNKIRYGVETDATGRQVAYWVRQDDGTAKRLPAYGEKTGRRLAWLLYGTDKRLDDVRGKPLLALVLQSLREIDRYRDATQRKALINSMLALFIKKGEDTAGTRPLAGGAVKKGTVQTLDASPSSSPRTWNFAEHVPGTVIDELAVGEEPVPFSTHGTDQAFGEFEAAILCGVAWSLELPPEILTLSFRNNYSASQAAINELKMYLNRARTDFGENFCKPVYREWLLAETLLKKIEAAGLVDSWRDPSRYDEFGAWVSSDWSGHIKPAVDLTKLVNGYAEMVNQGFITRARATRELTGMRYSKVAQKLEIENGALAEANKPLAPPKPAGPKPDEPVPTVPAGGGAPKADSGGAALELPESGEHELDAADEQERLPN